MKKVTTVICTASDGTEFRSEADCMQYEKEWVLQGYIDRLLVDNNTQELAKRLFADPRISVSLVQNPRWQA